jgi:hypothetical protein
MSILKTSKVQAEDLHQHQDISGVIMNSNAVCTVQNVEALIEKVNISSANDLELLRVRR